MDKWAFLLISIICETLGTTFMKISHGFTRLVPSVLAVVFYVMTPFFFSLALKKIDISVAYTVSASIVIASVTVIGCILFNEHMSLIKIAAIAMILTGIIMLNLSGATR